MKYLAARHPEPADPACAGPDDCFIRFRRPAGILNVKYESFPSFYTKSENAIEQSGAWDKFGGLELGIWVSCGVLSRGCGIICRMSYAASDMVLKACIQ
jgi:hypothetical protein